MWICSGRCIDGDDFDGDGIDDLAFASDPDPIFTAGPSKLWLRYGDGTIPDGETVDDYPRLQRDTNGGMFGNALAFVGDLDGDGYPELAVADEFSSDLVAGGGRVWVMRGDSQRWMRTSMIESTAWLILEGVEQDELVGSALLGLGDVDCDGYEDLAVAARYADGLVDQGGAVGVWLSPSDGLDHLANATALLFGGVSVQAFGQALATGDIDGSGVADLVVAAPDFGDVAGRAYVFLDVL